MELSLRLGAACSACKASSNRLGPVAAQALAGGFMQQNQIASRKLRCMASQRTAPRQATTQAIKARDKQALSGTPSEAKRTSCIAVTVIVATVCVAF